jgi:hypothetical protein
MNRTLEVEIDEAGGVRPLRPGEKLPAGRAILSWPVPEAALGLIMSEKALAENWLSPEEDAAWAHLQPVK